MKKIILTILTILVVSLPSSACNHHGEDGSGGKTALALLIAINFVSMTIMLVRAMVWAWNKKIRKKKEYINSPISYVFGNLNDDSLLPAMINTVCIAIIDFAAIVILLAMLTETLL